jgi:hypothetical protein
MATMTHYAAIQADTGTVYGIGATEAEALADARRDMKGPGRVSGEEIDAMIDSLTVLPCTSAAVEFVRERGGAPTALLSKSRAGVMLRDEEE